MKLKNLLALLMVFSAVSLYAMPNPEPDTKPGIKLHAMFAFPFTNVSFTWSYPATPTVPICTTTLTSNCVDHFQLTEPVTGITKSIPAVAGQTAYTFDLTPAPGGGSYTYSLVASEVIAGGTIPSAAATAVVVVPKSPDAPGGFTANPQ